MLSFLPSQIGFLPFAHSGHYLFNYLIYNAFQLGEILFKLHVLSAVFVYEGIKMAFCEEVLRSTRNNATLWRPFIKVIEAALVVREAP